MKRIRCLALFGLAAAGLLFKPSLTYATAGFAEWSIPTPLGNEVNHTDPFIGTDGTSVRPQGHNESDAPFIVKVNSWVFYAGYIAGKAEKGFFLFNEVTKEVEYFPGEVEQETRMREKGLIHPLSRPYDFDKGWWEAWAENQNTEFATPEELYEKTERVMDKGEWFQKLPEEQKVLQKQIMLQQIQSVAQFLREEFDFYSHLKQEIGRYPEFQRLEAVQQEQIRGHIEGRLRASTFVVESPD